MKRENGYYWVKYRGEWQIAEWWKNIWMFPGYGLERSDDVLDEIDEHRIERFAEANANTVLCGVAAPKDLKCCGNCINSRYYTKLGIPESMFCCAVSANRIKPHNMCEYWKQDDYEQEQRYIDIPKP